VQLPRVNRVMLSARATRDPELRYLASGIPVTRLSLAFEHQVRDAQGKGEPHVNYITAVATGPEALRAHEDLRKGGHVYLEGPLMTHHWTTPDGVSRSTIEIRVEHLQVLGQAQPEEPELPLEMPGKPGGGTEGS